MINSEKLFLLIAVCSLSIMLIGAGEVDEDYAPAPAPEPPYTAGSQAEIIRLTAPDFAKYQSCGEIELSFPDERDNDYRCSACCRHKERKDSSIESGVCLCDDDLTEPAVVDCSTIVIPLSDEDKEGWEDGLLSCGRCCDWQGKHSSSNLGTTCTCGADILY